MRTIWPFAIASTVLLAACSGWTVKSDYNPNANFGRYRTYAWLAPTSGSEEAKFYHSLTEQRIKGEVERDLAARGIYPATAGPPDFYITYRVSKQQVAVPYYGGYPGYWGYWGSYYGPGAWGPGAYVYTQGTLVLDFIDARTRDVFFRGYASHAIDNPESSPKAAQSVDRILKDYPAASYAAERRPRG